MLRLCFFLSHDVKAALKVKSRRISLKVDGNVGNCKYRFMDLKPLLLVYVRKVDIPHASDLCANCRQLSLFGSVHDAVLSGLSAREECSLRGTWSEASQRRGLGVRSDSSAIRSMQFPNPFVTHCHPTF